MKISTILTLASITFLGYYSYTNLYCKKKENIEEIQKGMEKLKIDIIDESEKEEDIIIEDTEPLTPLQKLVQDHFQIAHR